MIRSAVTVCLASELDAGPWIYWHDLEAACAGAARHGFDGIELFHAGADALAPERLRDCLAQSNLQLAAVGTGAGKVLHGLTLIDSDAGVRRAAREFIGAMIDFAADFGAPAIVGSMQGIAGSPAAVDVGREHLCEALVALGERAAARGTFVLFEVLNQSEGDLLNRQAAGVDLVAGMRGVRLLADLYHLHREEESIAGALRACGEHVGHVHFVDSNRRPAGCGDIDLAAVGAALRDIDFDGFASAEAFPWPDPEAAAEQTMRSFRAHLQPA